MNTADRFGNFDLCDHGVSLDLECEHCALLPGARMIKSQESDDNPDKVTINAIYGGDLAMHLLRRNDQPTRYAVAIVSAALVGLAVGLLMGSSL